MTFRITYVACVSPLGNQPVQQIMALKPVAHVESGDFVYNDSQAVYTFNGVTLNPTIFWDFVQTPNGAPANAFTAQYCYDRYHYHFGRAGLRNYRDFWEAHDAGQFLVYKQSDDHDNGYNNQDHSLAIFKAGFPISTNAAYGQILDDANFTQAQALQCWRLGQAGGLLLEQAYSDNPPRGTPNGDIPSAMVGTATAADYAVKYFYRDFGEDGKLGGNCIRCLFPDGISYKSPAAATDNASKQFWGPAQEAWMLASIQDAVNKGFGMVVVFSTKDLFNLDNGDGPWAYATARDRVLQAIHDNNWPVVWMCGDKHVAHAGAAKVANGQAYDCLSVCACPFGQGTGSLTQYKESIWFTNRNDTCVIGMVEVDAAARTVTLSILDAWTLDVLFSAVVPFGQRMPARITTNVQQNFLPAQSPIRVTPSIGASPYNYQNTTGRPQVVIIKGGTVSLIEYSSDNTTFDDTGASKGQFIVLPGHWLRTTYSVVPTLFAVYPYGFAPAP